MQKWPGILCLHRKCNRSIVHRIQALDKERYSDFANFEVFNEQFKSSHRESLKSLEKELNTAFIRENE